MIQVNNMSVDYGNQKGIFNISFTINKGEIVGFLGPNGAGKTTTIRQLMGFAKPDSGTCCIFGMNCKDKASVIQKDVGYLPGEIAFMDDMEGDEFIRFIADMKGLKDLNKAKELIDYFELNPHGKIKKMSKGMKQKIGLVCAFMTSPKLLILDEPTSGLDPLMQRKFVSLLQKEKPKGTTVFMSSHMFEEVRKTCERAIIIKEGEIVVDKDIDNLLHQKTSYFQITFINKDMANQFIEEYQLVENIDNNQVVISVQGELTNLFKLLSNYRITHFESKEVTLEDYFMDFYQRKEN